MVKIFISHKPFILNKEFLSFIGKDIKKLLL